MNLPRLVPALLVLCAFSVSPTFTQAQVTEELAKQLFAPNVPLEAFEKATQDAAKAGAPAQFIAEAKLVWGLRNRDTAFLSKIVPELEAAAKNFKKEDSASMSSVEEFTSLIHYIKALEAAEKGDEAGLKQNITEAFWLSPEQAQLFSQTISHFRTKARMANVTVDMKLPFTNSKAEATTLGDVLGTNKAVLLDFWASWCGPCMNLMPELRKKSEQLAKHGIVVAGMNIESSEAIADKVRSEKGMKDVIWLVEPKARPFSAALDVNSYPRMILLSPEGKVLFNGHPEENALWVALKKVDATVEPPKPE